MENKDMKKNKLIYEAPQLTVVEFRTERGYAQSSFGAVERVNMYVDATMAALAVQDANGNLVGGYMDGSAIDNSEPTGDWTLTEWSSGGGYF